MIPLATVASIAIRHPKPDEDGQAYRERKVPIGVLDAFVANHFDTDEGQNSAMYGDGGFPCHGADITDCSCTILRLACAHAPQLTDSQGQNNQTFLRIFQIFIVMSV
jgi:hypothetical protein